MDRAEQRLHIAVVHFLRFAWPEDLPYWHTPNGGGRDAREAALLKAMGTLPGVADLLFLLPGARLAAIELKSDIGRLSDAQKAFRDRVTALGAHYEVCCSVEAVETALAGWLATSGRRLRARTRENAPA